MGCQFNSVQFLFLEPKIDPKTKPYRSIFAGKKTIFFFNFQSIFYFFGSIFFDIFRFCSIMNTPNLDKEEKNYKDLFLELFPFIFLYHIFRWVIFGKQKIHPPLLYKLSRKSFAKV